jgi:hypothetical protein
MTVAVISVAVYYSTIAVVTSHLNVAQETKNTVWYTPADPFFIRTYDSPSTS